ncbi:MAG: DUF2218 domain-containing protein [Woeseiaceae bacterium]
MITSATVKTAFGEPYLKRLCRHFAHKIPATVDGQHGTIEFPFGICQINVDDQSMRFKIDVTGAENLERAEKVIADHLLRMANRDEPVIEWQRS